MGFYEKIKGYEALGKVYVIAEVGSNFKDHRQLLDSISLAKNCGADAVKFQFLTDSELYGPIPLIDSTFPLSALKQKADAVGIDLIVSTFSPEGMREVDKFVDCHKIASSEMSHIRLLEQAQKTGKCLILSTGGYFMPDIHRVVSWLRAGPPATQIPLILMHSNISYPAKYVDMKKFKAIKDAFPSIPLGYSDHTTNIDAVPKFLKENGVCIYEKHFNPFDLTDTPDAPHALNRDEFKTLVSYLRNVPGDYNEESEARLKHIRRVVALKDLAPGDRLKENDNMGIFRVKIRDVNGVNPFAIDRLEGKAVNKPIKAGAGISLNDVSQN